MSRHVVALAIAASILLGAASQAVGIMPFVATTVAPFYGTTVTSVDCAMGKERWLCPGNSKRRARAFIEFNYDRLAAQAAAGDGEHLAALGHLLGCPADAMVAFGRAAQADFERIFPARASPAATHAAFEMTLRTEPELALRCRGWS